MRSPTANPPGESAAAPSGDASAVAAHIRELLAEAASLAADSGVALDVYMGAAWQSFMDARPGLREQLEEMQLAAELDRLRRTGHIGQA
jgi:hypothetical protein